ncbi:APC family permease [Streptomyces sp. DSM 15324]|uniref:APC family permease n=1 Tax=Streptomyces sp. DSM 15324 TaxID=1739111 RepID=UPI000749A7FC|nr:APC family permease [Streptomyces sp. DSM 15324]KUO09730.1 amino acid transporter [Streptomyces sp. DSM 15324]
MTEPLVPTAPQQPPSAAGADQSPHLQRGSLGVADIVFFVVAAAAPLTVMAGVAPLAILFGGIGAPVAYLAVGVLLVLFAVGFTAMTPYIRNAGAFYAYISRGLGRPAGLGTAFLAVFSYNSLQIGLFGAFGFFASTTANDLLGVDLPWPVYAFAGIAVVWFLGFRSINLGAKVLAALLIAETAILMLLAGAVLVKGGASGLGFDSFAPSNIFVSGMSGPLGLAVAAFIGFEATAIYREEAREPDRTVPRATYLAIGFLGLFYAFIAWIIVQAFGSDQAVAVAAKNPAEMFFTAMTQYVGGWATDVQRVLIVTSVLAALLAFHNAITRYVYALSVESVAPAALGRVHPRHGSPWVAGIAQSVLAVVVVAVFASIGVDPYTKFFLWVNTPGVVGILVLQALAAFAVVSFFRRNRAEHGEGPLRTLLAPATAGVLLTAVTVLVCKRLDLFTGAGATVNWTLIALVPAVFLAGMARAALIRRTRPEVYAKLATTDVDAT